MCFAAEISISFIRGSAPDSGVLELPLLGSEEPFVKCLRMPLTVQLVAQHWLQLEFLLGK